MKKFNLLFLALFAWAFVLSQNWLPVNPNYTNNYGLNNIEPQFTIWIDSNNIINNDTIYYLNKVYKLDDSNWPWDYLILNQPSFLLSRFTKTYDTIKFFSSKSNASYKLILNETEQFLFDTINNTYAQSIIKTDTLLWETVMDSINVFLLSNGDNIIISREHGILKFPVSYNQNHYRLLGVQNMYGVQIPMFNDIFDFNPGDVFEYEIDYGYFNGYPNNKWYKTKKIFILQKFSSNNEVSYECKVKERIININGYWNTTDTSYSEYNETIAYKNYTNSFVNRYSSEVFNTNEIYSSPILTVYDSKYNCLAKYFGDYNGRSYCNYNIQDTLIGCPYSGGSLTWPIYLNDIDHFELTNGFYDYSLSVKYDEGLGITNKDYRTWDYGIHGTWSYELNLSAALTQTVEYGTFNDDPFFLVDVEERNVLDEVYIYPNPAKDKVTIVLPDRIEMLNTHIAIFDINGQILFEEEMMSRRKEILLEEFVPGIYILQVFNDENVLVSKFVKE